MKRAAALFALAAVCGDDLGRHEIPPGDAAPVTCRVPVSHPTIQAALDDASCPAVSIESGFYDENLAIARDRSLEAIGAVTIDGGGRDSVLVIRDDASVILVGLTLQNGRAGLGGGIRNQGRGALQLIASEVTSSTASQAGGGIHSLGPVRLERSAVRDNQVVAEVYATGGGIAAADEVILDGGSLVERNRVEASPGCAGGGIDAIRAVLRGASAVRENRAETWTYSGAAVRGGGIRADGVDIAGGSSVAGNLAHAHADYVDPMDEGAYAFGGGVYSGCYGVQPSAVRVEDSSIEGNQAIAGGNLAGQAAGGGLSAESCEVSLVGATIRGNWAVVEDDAGVGAVGGGLASGNFSVGPQTVDGQVTLVNSTIADNRASGEIARGGGMAATGPLQLYSVTLVGNRADWTGVGGEGSAVDTQGTLTLAGSILWDNGPVDLACGAGTSHGHNLIAHPGACDLAGATELDEIGLDPLLGPLADNGGPTLSRMPRAGSPAIDGGDPAGCRGPDDVALRTDQRGLPRPVGVCDIGAVEVQP